MKKFIETLEWMRSNWSRPEGLAVLGALIVTAILTIGGALKLPPTWLTVLLLVTLIVAALAWSILRRPRKTKRGKIGFVVAISPEAKSRSTVHADFVLALRRHLAQGPSASTFQLIDVPDHIASKLVSHDDAERLRRKLRGHFVIYGRVRTRELGGITHDILDLDGLVVHRPVAHEVSVRLGREFRELLPGRYQMRSTESFPAIEFTASWAGLIARYIIGIAAALSGDLDYAQKLFEEVAERLSVTKQGFLFYDKVKLRVPNHLSDIAFARARETLKLVYANKDLELLGRLEQAIADADAHGFKGPNWAVLRSIVAFLRSQTTAESRRVLESVPKKQRESVWHLNQAFLSAFDGDLEDSIRHYRKAKSIGIPTADVDVIIGQVEPFLLWQLEHHPDKFQLHFCLGFVNLQFKGDLERARADFDEFRRLCPPGAFEKEIRLIEKWLRRYSAHDSDAV